MIKQNLQKIQKVLKQTTHTIPQLLLKFYSFLLYLAKKNQKQQNQINMINTYAQVTRQFKKIIIQQPYILNKLKIDKLYELYQQNQPSIVQFLKIKDKLLKQFIGNLPNDFYSKKLINQLNDFTWSKKLIKLYKQGCQNLTKFNKLKQIGKNYNEITIAFWFGLLSGQKLLHVNIVFQKFQQFSEQYLPGLNFVNKKCKQCFHEICDNQLRYFISPMMFDEFIFKIRKPQVVQKLYQSSLSDNTIIINKNSPLKFIVKIQNDQKFKIQIDNQNIKILNQVKKYKFSDLILIGSSIDNEIVFKSKYISRKQTAIIHDGKVIKNKFYQINSHPYSIVCLSQSNFTIIKQPFIIKLNVGLIFIIDSVKYQVTNIISVQQNNILNTVKSQQIYDQEQDDRTLSIIPTKTQINNVVNNSSQQIQLLILSGQNKNNTIKINYQTIQLLQKSLKDSLQFNQGFYLKPLTKILLKSSNQVLQQRISKKYRLWPKSQIILDQYTMITQ